MPKSGRTLTFAIVVNQAEFDAPEGLARHIEDLGKIATAM